ncbi:hypothetical protein GWK47_010209 [Chionoecetes opilio]|uniref:Uncharacterized protein n=1 Tax=Chionoecetes opilio TaxID=41210 RepID=A0A8J5C3F9_CHIOP|nr:hypothetical protein GWK47_010209 [Chionoecetes opilio]
MESIACEKWTVSLLKQYLRDRAVPHSGYCKEKLVKLVKNSHENPSLVDQVEPTDGESVSESRRTITVNGDVVVFPDPHLLTGWDDNLTKIPSITSACCLIYLMNKRGWPAKRLENFENERGYQLCNDNHINTVQIKPHEGNMSYIRAKCVRQTAQKESPYCVWLLATNRRNIEASRCQCIGHDTSSPRPTVPHPESMYKACVFGSAYQDEDMDNDFRALLKETNAVHLQQSYEPSPATKFITLPELAQQFQKEQCTSFIVDLSQHFTDTIRENIRKFTKAQAKCSLWKKQRVGALTSTTLHLAAHYSRDCSDNYVVDSIMGQSKFSGNSATEYGKRSEPFTLVELHLSPSASIICMVHSSTSPFWGDRLPME